MEIAAGSRDFGHHAAIEPVQGWQDMTAEEDTEAETAGRADRRMLGLLVCPCTRTELISMRRARSCSAARHGSPSPSASGVPVMKPDEARPLDDEELRALGKR